MEAQLNKPVTLGPPVDDEVRAFVPYSPEASALWSFSVQQGMLPEPSGMREEHTMDKSSGSQWKELVGSVAPTLAGMLGGPLAGVAVSMLAETLLDDPQATEDDVASTLSAARVTDLNKLKNLEKDVRVQLRELGIQEKSLINDDKADARARHRELRDMMPGVLSVLLTLGFFGVLAALITGQADPGNEVVLQVMLGSLSTAWIGSMQFFFGTTQSSRDKNRLLLR